MSRKTKGRRGGAYARAGVDVGKVRKIQGSLAELFSSTFATRKGKFGQPAIGIGHYAGLIELGGSKLLSLHTDSVGTKVLVAQEMSKFDTVGIDCVAMTVNDLICLGSEPIALVDYIGLEREDAPLVRELSVGLAKGARESGAAIVAGETAIVGDILKGFGGRGFDLVSMGVGVVEKGSVVDGSAIREGDVVLGIASSGLHSNGYTLARRLVRGMRLDRRVEELGEALGDALLRPTRIYVRPTLEALRSNEVHGIAHVTGGAFTKLARLVGARRLGFDLGGLEDVPAPPIFGFLERRGRISRVEMLRTFNMGVGMCLVVPPREADAVLGRYARLGFDGWPIGSVGRREGVLAGKSRLA